MAHGLQASKDVRGSHLATCLTSLALLALDMCMAMASYGQFGWRVYSKIACDMRAKDGKSKQTSFLLIHGFLALLKLDALVRFFLCPVLPTVLQFNLSFPFQKAIPATV